MFKQIIAACLLASAVAFAPAGSRVRQSRYISLLIDNNNQIKFIYNKNIVID